MDASSIIFYCLAAVILGGAVMSVVTRKIFRAAIFLLFSLIGIAGLYFYLSYEFIAAVQTVVYVGGIVVLIIFSVFLTHESGEDMPKPVTARAVFSGLAAVFGFALTMMVINQHEFIANTAPAVEPSVTNIGLQMLSTTEHGYVLPFEVVSMLLLAAMVGCIVIAIKNPPSNGLPSVPGKKIKLPEEVEVKKTIVDKKETVNEAI
jgi:NADH-quinone oxidoreductase subunit J